MTKGKLLAVCLVWLALVAVLAAVWRWGVAPAREQAQEQARQAEQQARELERKRRLEATSSPSHYEHQLDFALDSFTGYCVLRSAVFENQLAASKIKLNLVDDGADYAQRLAALHRGEVQMAVFTIDALIKTSADLGDLPATIVAILDESRGADAMVAYKQAVPNLDALNAPDAKIVLTANSPSETLARVVMSDFSLERLPESPFLAVKDVENVFARYRAAKPVDRLAFVLWEPYVSKMLENPNMHVVIDSSRFRGYIVDVIVASRDFLQKNPSVVRDVVKSYFAAYYEHRNTMPQLAIADARQLGAPLTDAQADRLVEGVWWKNTQENFAHLGLAEGRALQHLEDMIANITEVLMETDAISADPTGGAPNLVMYDAILRELKESNWHPGVEIETVRDDTVALRELSEKEWTNLQPVGRLRVRQLVFSRGAARLSGRSKIILDELAETLETWPQYYVIIRGNASLRGDLEANKALAQQRAKAAEEYLVSRGIDGRRVRAVGVEPSGETSVNFIVGQLPY